MDDGPRATVLPLLLLVAVLAAVGLALYFTVVPGRGPGTSSPGDRPEEPDVPSNATRIPRVPRDGGEPPVVPRTGAIISGRVVDETGEAVAGATVYLYAKDAPKARVRLSEEDEKSRRVMAELYQRFPDEAASLYPLGSTPERPPAADEPLAETETLANGDFRFKKPYWGKHRILARKDRLSSGEQPVTGGRPVTLTLRESADVFGLVRFRDDSRPIGGATVRLRLAGGEVGTVTEDNGTFRFRGLPPGNVTIDVAHPEYAGEILTRVRLEPGLEKEVEVELTKGFTLTVVVRDLDAESESEPPIPEATVAALRIADDGYVLGKTDADGKVVFRGLPPGDYYVNGTANRFLPSGEEKVRVRADRQYELFLERAVYTTIVAVDERGVPVPGAAIWTSDPDEEFHEGISRSVGTTGNDGKFRFAFDFDGTHAMVYVMKKGYGVGIVTPDDPADGGELKVVLPPARVLRGRVTDEDGKPIAGAMVYLEVMVEDADQEDLAATLYTNENGEYRYDHLPPGEVWLEVEKEGYEAGDDDFETGPMSEHVKNFTLAKEKDD